MRQWAARGRKPGKSFLETWEEEWAGIAECGEDGVRQILLPEWGDLPPPPSPPPRSQHPIAHLALRPHLAPPTDFGSLPGARVVYMDGSYTVGGVQPEKAGWGVRMLDGDVDGDGDRDANVAADLCGPVVIDPRSRAFTGAEKLSNNTAELTALLEALELLTAKDAPFDTSAPTLVRPDSEYAAKIAVGISRPAVNKQLAEECRRLWKLAKEMRDGQLWLVNVRSHTGHVHNHAVDRLAAEGADGRNRSRADFFAEAARD